MLACPCLDDLQDPSNPCCDQFVESLACFVHNRDKEPATVCYAVFKKLHACVNSNREYFRDMFEK